MLNQHQLPPLLIDFRLSLVTQGLLKVSIKNYISDIYHFNQWFLSQYNEEMSVQNTTAEKISAYLNNFDLDDNLSLSTQKRKIATLRVFIHWLEKEKNLRLNDSVFKSDQEKRNKNTNFNKNLKTFNRWMMSITVVAIIFLVFVVFNIRMFISAQTEASGLSAASQGTRTVYYQNYEEFQQAYKFYKQQTNLGINNSALVFGFDPDTQHYFIKYGNSGGEGLRY